MNKQKSEISGRQSDGFAGERKKKNLNQILKLKMLADVS